MPTTAQNNPSSGAEAASETGAEILTPGDETLETREFLIDPRKVKLLRDAGKINAHYMTGDELRQLAANMKRDGKCTSSVLIYRENLDGEDYECISGNHRIEAAIMAGLNAVPAIEILTRLSPERFTAVQLSHNAIKGKDDVSLLQQLYDRLDLPNKQYSGLTDDAFKVPELDVPGLALSAPTYEVIELMFLPADADVFKGRIQEWEKRAKNKTDLPVVMACNLDDWQKLFDLTVRVKPALNVWNTAIAFQAIVQLAGERLAQIQAEKESAAAEPDAKA